jgi:alkanesulfonate monooxygenase SsuD/methylene tetrahydromethanopterin reductase-like flavin-dependent oxidoreductase (luciferase family)
VSASFGLFDILQVDPDRPTRDSLLERLDVLRRADDLGLDYAFVAERHFMPLYRAATPGLLLAQLAATTQRIRLGVMAYTVALHHPVLLAEEISALDHLSGGRLDVGVGLGHRPQEIDALGLPSAHRHAIFLEAIALLRQSWQGQPVTHDGALYHVRDALVDPPLQQPHPPLWYAGNDPAAATWAARNSLSLALGFQPDATLAAPARAFRSSRPDGATSHLAVMRHIFVAESDETAREEMTAYLMRVGAEGAAHSGGAQREPATAPTRAEAERVYADQQARQIVVTGSPERVAAQIAATLQTLDADAFLANLYLMRIDPASVERSLTLYALDVVPRVHELLASASAPT